MSDLGTASPGRPRPRRGSSALSGGLAGIMAVTIATVVLALAGLIVSIVVTLFY
jgi:hypothetical protein